MLTDICHSHGMYSFLANDRSRSAMKFSYGNKNYKFHHAHSNSTVKKRHLDTLARARAMEQVALKKRQSGSGSVPLTVYCEIRVFPHLQSSPG